MPFEPTEKRNPQQLTVNQHIHSAHSIAKFYGANNKVEVKILATNEIVERDNFLVFEEGGKFKPSKHFEMPENGGAVNYACQLGMVVDWSKVVAAAHTHPLYKNSSVNRLNEHFSQGDPSILIIKGIPLFLRTPKGKHIKVLEIRNGWVTTRNVTPSKESKPEKWKAKG